MTMTETSEPVYTKSKRWPARQKNTMANSLNPRLILPSRVFTFFIAAIGAFALSALTHIKRDLFAALQTEISHYRWFVLVEGAQIDIDEVGRSLEHFPGVAEVTYVSPAAAFEQLKNDPFLSANLSGLSASSLPGTWNVRWSPDFAVDQQEALIAEARSLSGVVDVAVDENQMHAIQVMRRHFLGARVLLAAFWVLIALLVVAGGLRLFFGRRPDAVKLAISILGFLFGGLAPWLLMR